MPTTNARRTFNINQARREIDFHDEILLLEPSKNPLTILTARMGKEATSDHTFGWFEDDLGPRWDTFPGPHAQGDLVLAPATIGIYQPRDVIKIPRTGEVMLVTAVAAPNITVVRGFGSTLAAPIVLGDALVIIGNASQEFATMPNLKDNVDVAVQNNTQIIRTPFGISGTMNATDTLTGKDLPYLRRKKAIEHAVDIERALLFGERNVGAAPTRVRTTGGVLSFLTANAGNFPNPAAVTYANMAIWFENLFRFGSSEKIFLASARWMTLLDGLGESRLQTVPKDKTYGINVNRLLTSHGELYVVKHHLLEGPYAGTGIALDMECLKYRYLQGRDTKLRTSIQPNDADGQVDEYLSEIGLEVRQPRRHGVARVVI